MIPAMNDYQQEQLAAFSIVREGLSCMDGGQRRRLIETTADYMQFRRSVDDFHLRHVDAVCTPNCYRSRTSACCSKDGIITFFADAVVDVLHAPETRVDALIRALGRVNNGHRCVYLADDGCMWTVRPVVCAMFLCDRAEKTVFAASPEASAQWEALKAQEKRFKWPDRPVLFDHLEQVFLGLGYRSTLMHLNMSPGLLRVKRNAGLI